MFDIGWTELVIIGVVALIVIGPRELPATLRTIGQAMTKLRRMASEFQSQFNDAMREAELDELRKQAEKLSGEMTSTIGNPLEKAAGELQSMLDAPEKSEPSSSAPSPSEPSSSATEPAPAQTSESAESAPAPAEPSSSGSADSGGGRAA